MQHKRYLLSIAGPAQGAGTRPYCLRLAHQLSLTGHICNSGDTVEVELQGSETVLQAFIEQLRSWLPETAEVIVDDTGLALQSDEQDFVIHTQPVGADAEQMNPALMPDRTPCEACLQEMNDLHSRRYRYPFISCTDCGPRYSISRHAPYERAHTSLDVFPLCEACESEYTDIDNRRFQAQTISCPACGPSLSLKRLAGETVTDDQQQIVQLLIDGLKAGQLVAVKGQSGFHLLADPNNSEAVSRLRALKQRPSKPFALMYPHPAMVREHCRLNDEEAELLSSVQGPLVLLQQAAVPAGFAQQVAPGCADLGVMLPASPFYHLLLAEWQAPLIVTSANRRGMPLVAGFEALQQQFAGCEAIDAVLDHDLELLDAMDDAIVQVVAGRPMLLRPGRGYAPLVMKIPELFTPVLATGALLKNTVAFAQMQTMVLSRYLGDMDDLQSQQLQQQQISRLLGDNRYPQLIHVGDLHPDMPLPDLPEQQAAIQQASVPHHLAHALAVELEHQLQSPYVAVCWDGFGYGDDGELWGGEFLSVSANGYQRIGRIRPLPLIGGEQAFREPRYMALALLMAVADVNETAAEQLKQLLSDADNCAGWQPEQQKLLAALIERGGKGLAQISSVGRLFDGIASLLDVCHINQHEAEAAMRLQALMSSDETTGYPGDIVVEQQSDLLELDWRPLITDLLSCDSQPAVLAQQFNDWLVQGMLQIVSAQPCDTVVLSGGCFQNRVLLAACNRALTAAGYQVFWPQQLPINDSGIAAGQVMAMLKQEKQTGI